MVSNHLTAERRHRETRDQCSTIAGKTHSSGTQTKREQFVHLAPSQIHIVLAGGPKNGLRSVRATAWKWSACKGGILVYPTEYPRTSAPDGLKHRRC